MVKRINTKYFKWEDLEYSDTARVNNINNMIPEKYIENGRRLILFLDKLREAFGKPININSGYRSKDLNKAVGGSETSSHLYALAADIRPNYTEDFNQFIEFVKDYLKDKDFDQCIIERSGKSRWIHIGIEHPKYGKRKQLFGMVVR